MEAVWFDGLSPARRKVTLRLSDGVLEFSEPGGPVHRWGMREYSTETGSTWVRFVRTGRQGECLLVEDAAFAQRFRSTGRSFPLGAVAALALLTVVAGAGLWFGAPLLADAVAGLVPAGAEIRLGRAVRHALVSDDERIVHLEAESAAHALLRRLGAESSPYEYEITWVKSTDINALAAPGGQIVVFAPLVCAMRSSDELAAVLAHEVSHVQQRHSTRNMVRSAGLRIILSLGGGADFLVDTAAMMGTLHYMRADEQAADRGGLELLVRSGIDPAAMANAFARLGETTKDMPAALQYLSSHPPIAERQKAARAASAGSRPAYRPALTQREWTALRTACGCR